MVVKQTERIPNVVRCLGCPIHKYGGLLGVVVVVVWFSIYSMGQYRQYVQQKGMGPTPVKSRGALHGFGRSGHYMRAYCFRYAEVPLGSWLLPASS